MKRVALISLLVVCLAVFVSARADSGSDYRFSAVFDSVQGMVPGQLVKIAGARVGKVTDVELIPGKGRYRARMTMEIDGKYGPFRSDASCRLLPEGLISEKFVDCDPGTPSEPELPAGETGDPEVTETETPLALQDVLNIFSAPTDQRLRILLNELGIATAGRGEDIAKLLRRTNPALTRADEVLSILNEQRDRIADSVAQTDRVLAELARDSKAVREFVAKGSAAAKSTAARPDELAAGIRELPPMLDAAETGLASLNRALAAGTPLLDDLRDAGPALTTFMDRLTSFSRAGLPAVRSVTRAAKTGRKAVPPLEKVVGNFRELGDAAPPVVSDLADFMVSLRDTNGAEGLLRTAYGLAVGAAARDNISHYYGAVINLFPICILVPPHIVPIPGCDHTYDSPEHGRIPINDPLYRSKQAQAFRKWLRIGGPELTPKWLRDSVPPLIKDVARKLGLDVDRILARVEGDSGSAESPARAERREAAPARASRPDRDGDRDREPKPGRGAGGSAGSAEQVAPPPAPEAEPEGPQRGLGGAVKELMDFLLR